jgi:hypothetical protein
MEGKSSHKSEGDRSYTGEGVLQSQGYQFNVQMQKHRAIQKMKGKASLCPEAAAVHLLLPWQLQQLQQGQC